MADCWSCGEGLGALRKVEREELCSRCETWIHCCKNCRHWNDSGRTCEEPTAEWVADRERSNFCDFYAMPSDEPDQGGSSGSGSDSKGARGDFDSLFK